MPWRYWYMAITCKKSSNLLKAKVYCKIKITYSKEGLSGSIPYFYGLERNTQTKTFLTKMAWKWLQESNYWLPMNRKLSCCNVSKS